MDNDREIARRAIDFAARGKDFRLLDIPTYKEWAKRQLKAGVSRALIAHLDATNMFLMPEELNAVEESVFDELLLDLKHDIGDDNA